MDLSKSLLDLVLVPLSILLTAGYHAYLWRSLGSNSNQTATSTKLSINGRNAWIQKISKEKEKGGGMLGVQSFRNSLMSAILSATIAVMINVALAALSNNALKANHLLDHAVFGIQSGPALPLKYAATSLLLLGSFLCCSMAVGFIIDANFLLNSSEVFHGYARPMMERGCLLATIGNRVFYLTLPFLMWLLGPVPLALASVAMVWLLYNLDFIDERKMRLSMLLSAG